MKRFLPRTVLAIGILASMAGVAFAATGTIDPNNTGSSMAAFLNTAAVSDPRINFGKFGTESAYNITVSDTELQGYAWGSSVGWMVMNCSNTATGCNSTNGSFKVANDGTGKLSGYAWGDNTGWINFGPFTDATISTVKIGADGNFGGTSGTAGYAWTQNYGWIVFDCSSPTTCVNTSWRIPSSTGQPVAGGGFPVASATPQVTIPTVAPAIAVVQPHHPPVNASVQPPVPKPTSITGPTTAPIGTALQPTIQPPVQPTTAPSNFLSNFLLSLKDLWMGAKVFLLLLTHFLSAFIRTVMGTILTAFIVLIILFLLLRTKPL